MLTLALMGGLSAHSVAEPTPSNVTQSRKTITDYKDLLGLSQEQLERIAGSVKSYRSGLSVLNRQLAESENELNNRISKRAKLSDILTQLKKAENLRLEARLLDLETSRTVRSVLTPQQWSQWQAMKQGKARNSQ
jgi:Spy/CpxP family protein refolding chaperone